MRYPGNIYRAALKEAGIDIKLDAGKTDAGRRRGVSPDRLYLSGRPSADLLAPYDLAVWSQRAAEWFHPGAEWLIRRQGLRLE